MDIYRILQQIPHRYPMLMVDRVIEWEPLKRAKGIKNVTANEPHFQGHYPEQPIMPGVLIVEAMAQVGGIPFLHVPEDGGPRKLPLLAAIDKTRFRRPVVPGDTLVIDTVVVRARGTMAKVACTASVDDTVVAEAEILFSIVDADDLL